MGGPCKERPGKKVVVQFNHFGIRRTSLRQENKKVIYYEPVNEAVFRGTVGNPHLLPSVSFSDEKVMFFDMSLDPKEKTNLFLTKERLQGNWSALLDEVKKLRISKRPSSHVVQSADGIDQETLRDLKAMGYIQ